MASLTSQTEDDLLASADANPTPDEILARAETTRSGLTTSSPKQVSTEF